MNNKNSSSLRCRHCGVVNWATDESCRRCYQPLDGAAQEEASPNEPFGRSVRAAPEGSSKKIYLYLAVFIATAVIPILIARATPENGPIIVFLCVMAAFGVVLLFKFLLLFEMFRVSIGWGIAGFFLSPFSTLLFAVSHWDRAKSKTLTMLAAIFYCIIVLYGTEQASSQPKVVQNSTAEVQSTPLTKYLDQTPTPKPDFLTQPRQDLLKPKKK